MGVVVAVARNGFLVGSLRALLRRSERRGGLLLNDQPEIPLG
jgi:hypothetical protein